jgi:hypothetical protein
VRQTFPLAGHTQHVMGWAPRAPALLRTTEAALGWEEAQGFQPLPADMVCKTPEKKGAGSSHSQLLCSGH